MDPYYFHYWSAELSLAKRLETAFRLTGVSEDLQNKVMDFLEPLKKAHLPTYEHSLRVGILASQIAALFEIDIQLSLLAGLLHDTGKINMLNLLDKVGDWTLSDRLQMEQHVMFGHNKVMNHFGNPFENIAQAMVRHHFFQPNPYPKHVPSTLCECDIIRARSIHRCGHVISVADMYDAMHRGGKPKSVRRALIVRYDGNRHFVERAYEIGIFTTP